MLAIGSVLTIWIDHHESTNVFLPLTIFVFLSLPHFLLSIRLRSVSMGTLSFLLTVYLPVGLWMLGYTAIIARASYSYIPKITKIVKLTAFNQTHLASYLSLAMGSVVMLLGVSGLNSSGVLPGEPIHLWGHDSLFHSTIAELYKNYGVSSIGLTDLRPISYHTFSHELFARISRLSGLQITTLYEWIPVALFGPILLSVLTEFAFIHANTKENINYIILKVVISFALLRLFLKIGLPTFDAFLASESFLIAFITLVSALNIMSSTDITERWWLIASRIAVMVFGISCCVASKVSFLFPAIALLLYLVIQLTTTPNINLNQYGKLTLCGMIILTVALMLNSVLSVADKIAKPNDFEWAYLLGKYGSLPFQDSPNHLVSFISIGLGVFFCFVPLWLYFYKSGFFKRAKLLIEQKIKLYNFSPFDFFMLSAVPSFLIGIFMPNFGGSGTYFLLPFLLLAIAHAIRGVSKICTIALTLLLSWNLVSANSWASAFAANNPSVEALPSADIEIMYIKKLNTLEHYEENSDPINFANLRDDAEKLWSCRGFYLPQIITGRFLSEGIPYGWRVPDCWFWPSGQRGFSDYPERLKVSLREYMDHPHKSLRLVLQKHAIVENLEVAQQWEEGQ
jgi:hypothetical protein